MTVAVGPTTSLPVRSRADSILKNIGGTFNRVYESHGIAGYDLLSTADRGFAFDYDHTGKLDDLVLCRPGVVSDQAKWQQPEACGLHPPRRIPAPHG